eukprot:IDg594t1
MASLDRSSSFLTFDCGITYQHFDPNTRMRDTSGGVPFLICTHKSHEDAIHAFGHPILLRGVGDRQLMLDTVVHEIGSEFVGQIFATIVGS